jgi:hypothetical protein
VLIKEDTLPPCIEGRDNTVVNTCSGLECHHLIDSCTERPPDANHKATTILGGAQYINPRTSALPPMTTLHNHSKQPDASANNGILHSLGLRGVGAIDKPQAALSSYKATMCQHRPAELAGPYLARKPHYQAEQGIEELIPASSRSDSFV